MPPNQPAARYVDPVTWAAIEAILICAYGPDASPFHCYPSISTKIGHFNTYYLHPSALAALAEACQGDTALDITWPDQATPPLALALEDLVGPHWAEEAVVAVELALAERGLVIEDLVNSTNHADGLILWVPHSPSAAELIVRNFPDPQLVKLIPSNS